MSSRDANGRFVKGKSGNPGGRTPDILSRAARKRVSPEDADKIMDVLVAMAIDGNLKAIELLWDRLEGKPLQAQHVTGELPIPQIREIIMYAPRPDEPKPDA